jgi:hypothetical protein
MRKHSVALAIVAFTLISLFWSGCTTQRIHSRTEKFETFYSRFHSDSAFQYSRLHFPLQGKRIDGDGERSWTKENWTTLTVPVFEVDTSIFSITYEQQPRSFTQKSWIDNSGFSVEFRFEVIKRKWYLVYAEEVNL